MHIWLGDSWVIGTEMGEDYTCHLPPEQAPYGVIDEDCPSLAFPHLVSTHYNEPYYNLASAGSSTHWSLYALQKWLQTNEPDEDTTVFLCTTGPLRRFGVDLLGRYIHTGVNDDADAIMFGNRLGISEEMDDMIKELNSRAGLGLYDHMVAMHHIYLLCKIHGMKLRIIDVWVSTELPECEWSIPSSLWVNEPGEYLFEHGPPEMDKYVEPYECHPNPEGHQYIADKIIERLNT